MKSAIIFKFQDFIDEVSRLNKMTTPEEDVMSWMHTMFHRKIFMANKQMMAAIHNPFDNQNHFYKTKGGNLMRIDINPSNFTLRHPKNELTYGTITFDKLHLLMAFDAVIDKGYFYRCNNCNLPYKSELRRYGVNGAVCTKCYKLDPNKYQLINPK